MGSFKKNGFDRNRSRSDERSNRGEFQERKPRFDRESRDFDSGRDGPRPFVRTSKGPLELFDAKCDKCGIDCELPFKPRGGKPVYCRDCFRNQNSESGFDGPSKNNDISTEQFITLNKKLDKIMRALKLD